MGTPFSPVPNGQERDRIAPDEQGDDEEDDQILFSFKHIRTASVILPSGDRVRKRVSLMSIYDESPFDEGETAALIPSHGTGETEETAYSSIAPTFVGRGQRPPDYMRAQMEKLKKWLHSEGLKRLACFWNDRVNGRVVKCSLAYWFGTLATLGVLFSEIMGKSDGMHLVATVAVYFHPARSIGSTSSLLRGLI